METSNTIIEVLSLPTANLIIGIVGVLTIAPIGIMAFNAWTRHGEAKNDKTKVAMDKEKMEFEKESVEKELNMKMEILKRELDKKMEIMEKKNGFMKKQHEKTMEIFAEISKGLAASEHEHKYLVRSIENLSAEVGKIPK